MDWLDQVIDQTPPAAPQQPAGSWLDHIVDTTPPAAAPIAQQVGQAATSAVAGIRPLPTMRDLQPAGGSFADPVYAAQQQYNQAGANLPQNFIGPANANPDYRDLAGKAIFGDRPLTDSELASVTNNSVGQPGYWQALKDNRLIPRDYPDPTQRPDTQQAFLDAATQYAQAMGNPAILAQAQQMLRPPVKQEPHRPKLVNLPRQAQPEPNNYTPEAQSVLGDIRAGQKQFTGGVAQGVGGLINTVNEFAENAADSGQAYALDDPMSIPSIERARAADRARRGLPPERRSGLLGYADDLVQGGDREAKEADQQFRRSDASRHITGMVEGLAPMLAGPAAPFVAAGMGGGRAYADVYNQLIAQGVPADEARRRAAGAGLASGAVEGAAWEIIPKGLNRLAPEFMAPTLNPAKFAAQGVTMGEAFHFGSSVPQKIIQAEATGQQVDWSNLPEEIIAAAVTGAVLHGVMRGASIGTEGLVKKFMADNRLPAQAQPFAEQVVQRAQSMLDLRGNAEGTFGQPDQGTPTPEIPPYQRPPGPTPADITQPPLPLPPKEIGYGDPSRPNPRQVGPFPEQPRAQELAPTNAGATDLARPAESVGVSRVPQTNDQGIPPWEALAKGNAKRFGLDLFDQNTRQDVRVWGNTFEEAKQEAERRGLVRDPYEISPEIHYIYEMKDGTVEHYGDLLTDAFGLPRMDPNEEPPMVKAFRTGGTIGPGGEVIGGSESRPDAIQGEVVSAKSLPASSPSAEVASTPQPGARYGSQEGQGRRQEVLKKEQASDVTTASPAAPPTPLRGPKGAPRPLPPMHEDITPAHVQHAWDVVSARYPKIAEGVKRIEPLPYTGATKNTASFNPETGVLRVSTDRPLSVSSLSHEFTHVAQGLRGKETNPGAFNTEEAFDQAVEAPARARGEAAKGADVQTAAQELVDRTVDLFLEPRQGIDTPAEASEIAKENWKHFPETRNHFPTPEAFAQAVHDAFEAKQAKPAEVPAAPTKATYTPLPSEWHGAKLANNYTVPNGGKLPGINGRPAKALPAQWLNQFTRIDSAAKPLADAVRAKTDEVMRLPNGMLLAPKKAVEQARAELGSNTGEGAAVEQAKAEMAQKATARAEARKKSEVDRAAKIQGIEDRLRELMAQSRGGPKVNSAEQARKEIPAEAATLWGRTQPNGSEGYLLAYLRDHARDDPRGTKYKWVEPKNLADGAKIKVGNETMTIDRLPSGETMIEDGITAEVDPETPIPAREVVEPKALDTKPYEIGYEQGKSVGFASAARRAELLAEAGYKNDKEAVAEFLRGNKAGRNGGPSEVAPPAPQFFSADEAGAKVDEYKDIFGNDRPVAKNEGLFGEGTMKPKPRPAETGKPAGDDADSKIARQYDPRYTAPMPGLEGEVEGAPAEKPGKPDDGGEKLFGMPAPGGASAREPMGLSVVDKAKLKSLRGQIKTYREYEADARKEGDTAGAENLAKHVRELESDLSKLTTPQPAGPKLASAPLANFAHTVQRLADASDKGFGKNKVFISDAYDAAAKLDPSLTLDQFKQRLIDAQRKGLVELSRADLVSAMHPEDVERSDTHYLNGTFNFIQAAPKERTYRTQTAQESSDYVRQRFDKLSAETEARRPKLGSMADAADYQKAKAEARARMQGGGGARDVASDKERPISTLAPKESTTDAPALYPAAPVSARTLRPVQMPELVRIATEITGNVPVVKKLRSALGQFKYLEGQKGRIQIDPNTANDPKVLAGVLAHEIGHAVDYLPENTLKRGALGHRLLSLTGHIAEAVSGRNIRKFEPAAKVRAELGVSESELKKELKDVSAWWRPLGDAGWTPYRTSSKELYADALSVFLNSPGHLQERAPKFYDALMRHMDRKPEFKDAYLSVQDLLAGTHPDLAEARRADVREDFAKGEEIIKAREGEREANRKSIMDTVRTFLFDKSSVLLNKEKEVAKKIGPVDEQLSARHALNEFTLAENAIHKSLSKVQAEVVEPTLKAGLTQADLGEFLFFKRIAEGGRAVPKEAEKIEAGAADEQDVAQEAEIANPRGHTIETAKTQLKHMEDVLGEEKWQAINQTAGRFHEIVHDTIEEGAKAGVYSPEWLETARKNKENYASFAVLDHLQARIPAAMRKQVGTFKSVANPFTSTVMKMVSTIRLTELNKAKNVIRDFLGMYYPKDIGDRGVIDKFHRERKAPEGRENLMVLENGKLATYPVDPYINKIFQSHDIGMAATIGRALSYIPYKVFHPLFVSYNPGFGAFNLARDFMRTHRNLSGKKEGVSVGGLLKAYWQTKGEAWRRARGVDDPTINKLFDMRALSAVPFAAHDSPELGSKADRLMEQYGIKEQEGKRNILMRAAGKVLDGIETLNAFTETLPKTAAYKMLSSRPSMSEKEIAYTLRKKVGTPDIYTRGTGTTLTNGIWMYSNVFLQGIRADAEASVSPKTRAGWWMKFVTGSLIPRVAMRAAAAGLMGAAMKQAFSLIPNDDQRNYLTLPLGVNDAGKAAYIRFPQDETARMLGGIADSIMSHAAGEPNKRPWWQDMIDFGTGQLPNFNPVINMGSKWLEYAQGGNPRDSFRGSDIIPKEEKDAGGWYAAGAMSKWTLNQFGILSTLGQWLINPGDHQTTTEKVVGAVPILNRFLKYSDRGLDEDRWAEADMQDGEKARLKLGLGDDVRQVLKEHYRLSKFKGKLTADEQHRLPEIQGWYKSYLDLTKIIASEVSTPAMKEKARQEVMDQAKLIEQLRDPAKKGEAERALKKKRDDAAERARKAAA